MRHIYFVDDMAGRTWPLIKKILADYRAKKIEVKVHLLMLVQKHETEDAEKRCKSIKNSLYTTPDMSTSLYLLPGKNVTDVFDYQIIPYRCKMEAFYGSKEEAFVLKQIGAAINETHYVVAIDLMLLSQIDKSRINETPIKRVLSHDICEKYFGRCLTYSSMQAGAKEDEAANFNKWVGALALEDKDKLEFYTTYDYSSDYHDLAMALYYLTDE